MKSSLKGKVTRNECAQLLACFGGVDYRSVSSDPTFVLQVVLYNLGIIDLAEQLVYIDRIYKLLGSL